MKVVAFFLPQHPENSLSFVKGLTEWGNAEVVDDDNAVLHCQGTDLQTPMLLQRSA
jgi:hypothetical protein